jgi:PAS domain-containing protein
MRPVQAKEWAVVDYLLEPMLDPDRLGRAIRYAVERKRALALIEESEARKRAILETAIDSIVSIDAEGRITEFNTAAERTFGWRRDSTSAG